MTQVLDPVFAAGVRRALVERPSLNRLHLPRHSRRTWFIGGLTLALVGTAGVATGVLLVGPGGQIVTELSAPVTVSGNGNGVLNLGAPPSGATAVQYEFTCLTPGSFKIGYLGTEIVCGPGDVGSRSDTGGGQLSLDGLPDGTLAVSAGTGQEWHMTAEYVATEITPLAVNANGETYGSEGYGATPDLILAIATTGREGYVRRTELDAAGGPEPTSPAQAIEIQKARPPGSIFIPVYESDGITVIGQFEISN